MNLALRCAQLDAARADLARHILAACWAAFVHRECHRGAVVPDPSLRNGLDGLAHVLAGHDPGLPEPAGPAQQVRDLDRNRPQLELE
eukprot:2691976-Pyramimonas_sp.AAC.1